MAPRQPKAQWCIKITRKSRSTRAIRLSDIRDWFGSNTTRVKQDGSGNWLIAYDTEDHCREHIDFAEENTGMSKVALAEAVYTLWAVTENDLLAGFGAFGV